jgi:hypothetical protein
MQVDQLPAEAREFTRYLEWLSALLHQGGGWYGVFWQRDPDGMRACLEGRELPPWDVVQALLQDLATRHGKDIADRETTRAAELHAASAAARDALPGGRRALHERLQLMLREQQYAAEHEAGLMERLHHVSSDEEAEQLGAELSWARDDHERATARCTELRARMVALGPAGNSSSSELRVPEQGWFRDEVAPGEGGPPDRGSGDGSARPGGAAGGALPPRGDDAALAPHATYTAWGGGGVRQGRSEERSGGSAVEEPGGTATGDGRAYDGSDAAVSETADAEPPAPEQPRTTPTPPGKKKRKPRGARYAGTPREDSESAAYEGRRGRVRAEQEARQAQEEAAEARQLTAHTVNELVRLRSEGRGGEAYVVLCEAAGWSPELLPELAAELHRAGLSADWVTLLWEMASLPPERLAAAAGALTAAGRDQDCHQLLRQSVARPAAEVAEAVLALEDAGRRKEAQALLDAHVRTRTPEESALIAEYDPPRLARLLLRAARGVSDSRHCDIALALRVAGISS